jgi:hypothetical protein
LTFPKSKVSAPELEIKESECGNANPKQNDQEDGLRHLKEECGTKFWKKTEKNAGLRQRKDDSGWKARVAD